VYVLTLTRGGGAELEDPHDGEVVWESVDDDDFKEEFPNFLTKGDVFDILDFLVEVGELTPREADDAEIREEFLTPADLTGFIPDNLTQHKGSNR
jgi:hypothetical protein